MTNLFCADEIATERKKIKRFYALTAICCVIATAICVAACLLVDVIGRFAAQTVATVVTAALACGEIYGFAVVAARKKSVAFLQKALNGATETVTGKVTEISADVTTSEGLPFVKITLKIEREQRVCYVLQGKPLPELGSTVTATVCGKYLTAFGEAAHE